MNSEIDFLLSKYSAELKILYDSAHALIIQHFPGILPMPDLAANMVAFGFGNSYAATICTLIFSKKEIKLGFYKGAALPDPGHLLAGKGKVHKYVVLQTPDDCRNPMLHQLLTDAHKAYQQRQRTQN
jgi:hypothetical protein